MSFSSGQLSHLQAISCGLRFHWLSCNHLLTEAQNKQCFWNPLTVLGKVLTFLHERSSFTHIHHDRVISWYREISWRNPAPLVHKYFPWFWGAHHCLLFWSRPAKGWAFLPTDELPHSGKAARPRCTRIFVHLYSFYAFVKRNMKRTSLQGLRGGQNCDEMSPQVHNFSRVWPPPPLEMCVLCWERSCFKWHLLPRLPRAERLVTDPG